MKNSMWQTFWSLFFLIASIGLGSAKIYAADSNKRLFEFAKRAMTSQDFSQREMALREFRGLAVSDTINAKIYDAWQARTLYHLERYADACNQIPLNAKAISIEHPGVWIEALDACRKAGRKRAMCRAAIQYVNSVSSTIDVSRVRAFAKRNCEHEVSALSSMNDKKQLQLVKMVQQKLQSLGFDPGPVDGQFGQATKRAVAEFEKYFQYPQTAKINKMLLARLNVISNYSRQKLVTSQSTFNTPRLLPMRQLTFLSKERIITLSSLAALPNTRLTIHLWASWCAPCIEELPHLLTYLESDDYAKAKNEGAVVLPISLDIDAQTASDFLKRQNIYQFPVNIDVDQKVSKRLFGKTGVELPATVTVDLDADKVLSKKIGPIKWTEPSITQFVSGTN